MRIGTNELLIILVVALLIFGPKNLPPRWKRLSLPLHPPRKRPSLQRKRLPHRKLPRLPLRPSRWRKTLVRMMFCRRTDYLLDAPAPAVA